MKEQFVFQQHDVVRIVKMVRNFEYVKSPINLRRPAVGDRCTIVEIYDNAELGYELECTNAAGETQWLLTYAANEIELELVSRPAINSE